jgi:DNA primase
VKAGHAREVRRALVDARTLATALGLHVARGATPLRATVLCPWHSERSPSCSVWLAKDGTLAVRCHACGATGDALTLIKQVQGLDEWCAVLRAAAEIANLPAILDTLVERPARPEQETVGDEDYDRIWSLVLDACALSGAPAVARYLDERDIYADADAAGVRGLPTDTRSLVAKVAAIFEHGNLEFAGVLRPGREVFDWPAWSVLIPWRDRYGRVQCVQRRRLDAGKPKYRFTAGRAPRAPFGVEHLAAALDVEGPDAEVVIVEGAIDCLARRRVARHRDEHAVVIGVASASTPCAGLPLDLLAGRRLVLALDDDEAGERACAALAAELSGVARELVRERPVGPAKDWADALRAVG